MTEFNPQLADQINAAVAKALGSLATPARRRKAKGKGRVKPTPEETAARMAANDAECIKVFTEAGYKEVKPRVNVLTYNKWIQEGRLVRQGEKSHRVGPFNLFHIDQTDTIGTKQAA